MCRYVPIVYIIMYVCVQDTIQNLCLNLFISHPQLTVELKAAVIISNNDNSRNINNSLSALGVRAGLARLGYQDLIQNRHRKQKDTISQSKWPVRTRNWTGIICIWKPVHSILAVCLAPAMSTCSASTAMPAATESLPTYNSSIFEQTHLS